MKRRIRDAVVLLVLLGLAGCGGGADKTGEAAPSADKKALEQDQKAYAELKQRYADLEGQVQALPAGRPEQGALRDELVSLLSKAKLETTRADPLHNTLPPKAMERMKEFLDAVENKLSVFPR
ncbi:MAG: hypothetical protein M5U26_15245 [Planctomycetota bacterium]|nr:hypothetical protein [Planctomycetota bacterium]